MLLWSPDNGILYQNTGRYEMRFEHTNRHGFWIGFVDFFTAGIFLLVVMRRGLQDELDAVLGRRTQRYAVAYLLGIPTLFLYTLVWMARIAEELKAKALELGIQGKLTSFRHMFDWNTFGLFLFGPAIATQRFFDTLNKVEARLNAQNAGGGLPQAPQGQGGAEA